MIRVLIIICDKNHEDRVRDDNDYDDVGPDEPREDGDCSTSSLLHHSKSCHQVSKNIDRYRLTDRNIEEK